MTEPRRGDTLLGMAHDYTKSGRGGASGSKPRDFLGQSPAQTKVKDPSLSTDEIPEGGVIPAAAPPPARAAETATKKPFRVS